MRHAIAASAFALTATLAAGCAPSIHPGRVGSGGDGGTGAPQLPATAAGEKGQE